MVQFNSIQFIFFPSHNIVEHHIYIIILHNTNKKDNVRKEMWMPPKTLGVKLEAPIKVTIRLSKGKYTSILNK